jgi:hypothetical protein
MQRVVLANCIGAGLDHERSAMSRAKSPISNFGTGKFRTIVTTAAAARIGTLVGGASVLGFVTAVTQPPAHDIKADGQPGGGTAAPAPSGQTATLPPQAAPVVAERQSAPAAEGFRAVWPDALSARANHGAEPAPATPAPQQASPPANDQSALNQSEQYGAGREEYAANSAAATSRDSQPNQISPNTAPAKYASSYRRPANSPTALSTKCQQATHRLARRAATRGNRNRRRYGNSSERRILRISPVTTMPPACIRRSGASSSFPAPIKRQTSIAAIGAAACSIFSAKTIRTGIIGTKITGTKITGTTIGTTEPVLRLPRAETAAYVS